MGALSRLLAKELSSALGIADNPKYNPAFKDKSKTNMRALQTLEDEQDFGDDLGQYIPDDDDMPTAEEFMMSTEMIILMHYTICKIYLTLMILIM